MIPDWFEVWIVTSAGALEGCKAGRTIWLHLPLNLWHLKPFEGIYNVRDRISLISKLISTSESTGSVSLVPDFTGLLRLPCDWNSLWENLEIFTWKYVIFPEFNLILPKIPLKIDFQILLSRAICRISENTSVPYEWVAWCDWRDGWEGCGWTAVI